MESNHRFLFVRQMSSPLDHRTVCGSRGTRTPKSRERPTVFKTASSSGRMASVSCGGWNRTNTKTFRASRPTVRRPRSICCTSSGGRNRTYGLLLQRQASLPPATPRECLLPIQEGPAGANPASPAWKAGTFAARPRAQLAEGVRIELTRLIARLCSKQLPSPIGLPFRRSGFLA